MFFTPRLRDIMIKPGYSVSSWLQEAPVYYYEYTYANGSVYLTLY
jgi:hypothetical protein